MSNSYDVNHYTTGTSTTYSTFAILLRIIDFRFNIIGPYGASFMLLFEEIQYLSWDFHFVNMVASSRWIFGKFVAWNITYCEISTFVGYLMPKPFS